jgi:hypothetical protein
VRLVLTQDPMGCRLHAEQGAITWRVETADGTQLGKVERRVEESWRKSGRLRTSKIGYARHWRAHAVAEVARPIQDDDSPSSFGLWLGVCKSYSGDIYCGRYHDESSSRRQALELLIAAARRARVLPADAS